MTSTKNLIEEWKQEKVVSEKEREAARAERTKVQEWLGKQNNRELMGARKEQVRAQLHANKSFLRFAAWHAQLTNNYHKEEKNNNNRLFWEQL